MTADVPDGALSIEAVVHWLPDRRLGIEYVPQLVDQEVERIRIDIGIVTGDDQGEWITAVYVGDTKHELVHAVGYDLEADGWVGIDTWTRAEYDADDVEETVVEWVDERYPDSKISRT